MTDWTTKFGAVIQTKDGAKSTNEILGSKKVVGIYFSAHWCPPCRAFTPVLSTMYEDIVEDHPDFEIVFVSSDQDQSGFDLYYGSMPFKALPFTAENAVKANLASEFGVQGIPMLVFLDASGNVITKDGRTVIQSANGDVEKVWSALAK